MATVQPNVVGLTFAKRLEFQLEKRELSLIGIFQNVDRPEFPTSPIEMIVFAMVNGGRGEGVLQLAVYSLSAAEGYDMDRDWIYRQRKWVRYPDDPNFTVTIEIRVRNLIFFEPGEYLFVLSFDGKLITERRISVRRRDVAP